MFMHQCKSLQRPCSLFACMDERSIDDVGHSGHAPMQSPLTMSKHAAYVIITVSQQRPLHVAMPMPRSQGEVPVTI